MSELNFLSILISPRMLKMLKRAGYSNIVICVKTGQIIESYSKNRTLLRFFVFFERLIIHAFSQVRIMWIRTLGNSRFSVS